MKLSKKLSSRFELEFEKVFQKEKADKDFLKQEDFSSCRERAEAGIIIAIQAVIDDLGYSIAIHREKEHGDDTKAEQATLLESGANPEMGTMAWWND